MTDCIKTMDYLAANNYTLKCKGEQTMDIEVRIEKEYKEPKLIILTESITDDVRAIIDKISEKGVQHIAGYAGNDVSILRKEAIFRIYAYSGKVIAITKDKEYVLKQRLYELESMLSDGRFVRISNSEIVNLDRVNKFDLSLSGTIRVYLSNGDVTYVSRRYVSKIKEVLGI